LLRRLLTGDGTTRRRDSTAPTSPPHELVAVVPDLRSACWSPSTERSSGGSPSAADARALLTLIPDCVILVGRLARDPRVTRRRKLLLLALVGYLALPFDLVPDFIPVAGQLDDAIIVALILRRFVRSGGEELIRELWPGPEQSLALILRLAQPVG
jgi:uncharacterized membrane protein YkvA (DUF1232 family)